MALLRRLIALCAGASVILLASLGSLLLRCVAGAPSWWLAWPLCAAVAWWCVVQPHAYGCPWWPSWFFLRFALELLDGKDVLVSRLGLLQPVPLLHRRVQRCLDSVSQRHRVVQRTWLLRCQRVLTRLRGRTQEEQRTIRVLSWFVDVQLEGWQWRIYAFPLFHHLVYPLNQFVGAHDEVMDAVVDGHTMTNEQDVDDLCERLRQWPKYIDDLIEDSRVRASHGWLPPGFVWNTCLQQVERRCVHQGEQHALVRMTRAELRHAGMRAECVSRCCARVARGVADHVVPAYRALAQYMRSVRERMTTHVSPTNVCPTGIGLSARPGGAQAYGHFVRRETSLPWSAERVHDVGQRHVAGLQERIHDTLQAMGLPRNTASSVATLHRGSEHQAPGVVLAAYARVLARVRQRMQVLFRRNTPDHCWKLGVARVPLAKEATAAGAFYSPPALASLAEGGTFYVNLGRRDAHAPWARSVLAVHEGAPGHHFQYSYAQSQAGLPLIRRALPLNAYTEGWALYAEALGDEVGVYDAPDHRLGFFLAQMLRAARLVVDTGIHARRWSRDQAVAYLMHYVGCDSATANTEVDRYVVCPGQALGYTLGMLKFQEVRRRAQQHLERAGVLWDVREFHHAVLCHGAVPLEPELDMIVDDWIQQQLQQPQR